MLVTVIVLARFATPQSALSSALTIDFIFTIPLAYLWSVRRTRIPASSVGIVFLACLGIATLSVPEQHQGLLDMIKTFGAPAVELSLLTYVGIRGVRFVRKLRAQGTEAGDAFEILNAVFSDAVPGRLGAFLATELATLYYGLFHWRTVSADTSTLTHHRRSGTPALLWGLALILCVEAPVLHLLLARWSELVAWIVTGLGVYSLLQIIGFARALGKRPHSVSEQLLTLRYGVLAQAEIPLKTIKTVSLTRTGLAETESAGRLSPLGELENYNTILELDTPVVVVGPYGKTRQLQTIALWLDEPERLQNMLG